MKTIVSSFEDYASAREAVRRLTDEHDVDSKHIGVLMSDSPKARELLEEGPGSTSEGAKIGSAIGGSLAGIAAVALTTASGVFIAAGPLIALVGGAGVGAGAGGLLGALIGMNIPENEAALRAKKVEQGGVLVTVQAEEGKREEEILDVLEKAGSPDAFVV